MMDTPFRGFAILFIGINFYDYDIAIKSELKKLGATINYINTCRYNLLYKMLNRLGFNKLAVKYSSYIRIREINRSPSNNNFVFVIKGEHLTSRDLNMLKKKNPSAKFILYLWDDFNRHKNKELLLKWFENIWSFDRIDCEKYNFKFRPLFYRTRCVNQKSKYFLSFIAGLHSDRLEIARRLKQLLNDSGKDYFIKLYLPYISYLKERYLYHNITSDDNDIIITKPLPYYRCQQISAQSVCVVDIPYLGQAGLSIRTIETLANGNLLLTANNDILNYRDIPTNMYRVIDRENLGPSAIKYGNNRSLEIPVKYSLTSFLLEIFEINID